MKRQYLNGIDCQEISFINFMFFRTILHSTLMIHLSIQGMKMYSSLFWTHLHRQTQGQFIIFLKTLTCTFKYIHTFSINFINIKKKLSETPRECKKIYHFKFGARH